MSDVVKFSAVDQIHKYSKREVAEAFRVSLTTIDSWIRKGCPVVKRGRSGVPWELDVIDVARWRFSSEVDVDDDVDPRRLQPAERKAWYESENKRRDLQERDRDLISAGEVERVVAVAFSALAHDMRAIPDNLERRDGISGEVAELVEQSLFEAMDGMADRLSTLGSVESE